MIGQVLFAIGCLAVLYGTVVLLRWQEPQNRYEWWDDEYDGQIKN